MEFMKADTGVIRSRREEAEGILMQIRTKTDTLQGDLAALREMWSGEAREIFEAGFQGDLTDFLTVCDFLESALEGQENAAAEYEACEDRVADAISQIG